MVIQKDSSFIDGATEYIETYSLVPVSPMPLRYSSRVTSGSTSSSTTRVPFKWNRMVSSKFIGRESRFGAARSGERAIGAMLNDGCHPFR